MKKHSSKFSLLKVPGFHLSVGFLLTIIGAWLFSGMLIGVVFTHHINVLDLTIADTINHYKTPQLTSFFRYCTNLGSWGVGIIGIVVTLVCLFYHKWFLSTLWVVSITGAFILNVIIKSLVQRPRPPEATIPGFSFPSGHAMISTVAYGMLAYYVLQFVQKPLKRVITVSFAIALILLIGFSRIYLEVHYFSDVIGGYGAGMIWLLFCIFTLNTYNQKR